MEPNEFRLLRTEVDRAWESLGHVSFGTTVDDASSSKHRRSIFIVRDMKKGDSISFNDLRIVRPGIGLAPKYFDLVLGMSLTSDVHAGTPVTWNLFK